MDNQARSMMFYPMTVAPQPMMESWCLRRIVLFISAQNLLRLRVALRS
jgi:hypothetical protein